MFSLEQRRIALGIYIKYDHSYTAAVVELGYPAKETMRKWWKEYKATGEIPVGKTHRKSKYSDEQAQAAVNHYLEHGKSLTRTMRALGYPRGRETLCGWIDELAPDERKKCGPNLCSCTSFFLQSDVFHRDRQPTLQPTHVRWRT